MSGLDVSPDMDPQDVLAHYGVKGMQWGKRKASDDGDSSESSSASGSTGSRGLSDGQKKALKYAAGGALIAGALITTAVLAKNGKLPIGSLMPSKKMDLEDALEKGTSLRDKAAAVKQAAATAKRGKEVMDELRASDLFKKEISDFQSQIDQAHQEQNRRMIEDSANAGLSYDPSRDNEYSPEARR